jgi:hypothetical protein
VTLKACSSIYGLFKCLTKWSVGEMILEVLFKEQHEPHLSVCEKQTTFSGHYVETACARAFACVRAALSAATHMCVCARMWVHARSYPCMRVCAHVTCVHPCVRVRAAVCVDVFRMRACVRPYTCVRVRERALEFIIYTLSGYD